VLQYNDRHGHRLKGASYEKPCQLTDTIISSINLIPKNIDPEIKQSPTDFTGNPHEGKAQEVIGKRGFPPARE
jgi:hypothetical protein